MARKFIEGRFMNHASGIATGYVNDGTYAYVKNEVLFGEQQTGKSLMDSRLRWMRQIERFLLHLHKYPVAEKPTQINGVLNIITKRFLKLIGELDFFILSEGRPKNEVPCANDQLSVVRDLFDSRVFDVLIPGTMGRAQSSDIQDFYRFGVGVDGESHLATVYSRKANFDNEIQFLAIYNFIGRILSQLELILMRGMAITQAKQFQQSQVERRELVALLQQYHTELVQTRDDSLIDELTQLTNRKGWNKVIQRLHEQKIKGHALFIDVDNFKHMNDINGHERGDVTLKHIALILKAICQTLGILIEPDYLARLGGDEFVIVIPQFLSDMSINNIGNALLQAIRCAALHKQDGLEPNTPSISFSIGFSSCDIISSDLVNQADQTMYFAKKAGRDRFAFHGRIDPDALVARESRRTGSSDDRVTSN